ncbi:2OG-Fe(II) oxygenase [uncultured Aquimarina sp.]|uniref:2OG-Fe(II) oxygenase n=1 Tax=uncultured Aquimarina sp. TaxID=575652 RepID=UPI0026109BA9|nr:2OG-Fe(II) oxygenase [uncultured Aquimarina sp.]
MSIILEDFRESELDNWYWFQEALTNDELVEIETIQESIPFTKAKVSQKLVDLECYRKSEVKWFPKETIEHRWLYEKFINMITESNRALWNFELTSIFDDLQYTVYNGEGGHFDWHMDIGKGKYSRRKVSITLQLSDPDEYEGGDFEFLIGNEITKLPRKKGCAIVFPSYFLHRVTPVTKGVRKSLVLWVSGQPFR